MEHIKNNIKLVTMKDPVTGEINTVIVPVENETENNEQ